jgi:hypothetical protein
MHAAYLACVIIFSLFILMLFTQDNMAINRVGLLGTYYFPCMLIETILWRTETFEILTSALLKILSLLKYYAVPTGKFTNLRRNKRGECSNFCSN